MAEEPRFDWPAMLKALGIIAGVTAAIGFLIPVVVTLAFKLNHTGRVSGHDIYRWAYWAVAWALTIWQGSVMLRRVHDAIIDDMVLTSVIAGVVLLIVKAIITLVFEPTNSEGELLPFPFTSLDVGGALILVVVALIASRINKY